MMNVIDPKTGKPRLLSEQCWTCVGRPHNEADLRPGRLRELIQSNTGPEAYGLVCHETLDYDDDGEPCGDRQAFCHWFYEQFGQQANYIRICERLGGFTEVDPPRERMAMSESWGSRDEYAPGDRVVKMRGSLAGTIIREVRRRPGRTSRRYSVRDDISGTTGCVDASELRPLDSTKKGNNHDAKPESANEH